MHALQVARSTARAQVTFVPNHTLEIEIYLGRFPRVFDKWAPQLVLGWVRSQDPTFCFVYSQLILLLLHSSWKILSQEEDACKECGVRSPCHHTTKIAV